MKPNRDPTSLLSHPKSKISKNFVKKFAIIFINITTMKKIDRYEVMISIL